MRYLWSVLLLSAVIGCASLPSQNYSFSLASDKDSAQWTIEKLAKNGSISLKTNLPGGFNSQDRLRLDIAFGYREHDESNVGLRITDYDCTGAYTVGLAYRTARNQITEDLFKTRIAWGAPFELVVTWNNDRYVTVAVNGESKSILLQEPISDFYIKSLRGELPLISLRYQNDSNK